MRKVKLPSETAELEVLVKTTSIPQKLQDQTIALFGQGASATSESVKQLLSDVRDAIAGATTYPDTLLKNRIQTRQTALQKNEARRALCRFFQRGRLNAMRFAPFRTLVCGCDEATREAAAALFCAYKRQSNLAAADLEEKRQREQRERKNSVRSVGGGFVGAPLKTIPVFVRVDGASLPGIATARLGNDADGKAFGAEFVGQTIWEVTYTTDAGDEKFAPFVSMEDLKPRSVEVIAPPTVHTAAPSSAFVAGAFVAACVSDDDDDDDTRRARAAARARTKPRAAQGGKPPAKRARRAAVAATLDAVLSKFRTVARACRAACATPAQMYQRTLGKVGLRADLKIQGAFPWSPRYGFVKAPTPSIPHRPALPTRRFSRVLPLDVSALTLPNCCPRIAARAAASWAPAAPTRGTPPISTYWVGPSRFRASGRSVRPEWRRR